MRNNSRILIAVDGSDASVRAVQYVSDIASGRPALHVGLLHLELPPRMLEWGGSEDPAVEAKVSAERAAAYREREKKAIEGGRRDLLQKCQGMLTARGIDVTGLLVQFEEPLNPKSISIHILKTAQERDYGTVVVGRHSFSGLRSWFQHYVGEELVRTGKGIAVWVIE